MFKKILIANRGEIACRVIRTAHRLGIYCATIYSSVDQFAQHIKQADEAYFIGPAPTQESYLQADKIIEIALKAGAQAIHPGYGFLSENAAFADKCAKAGICFIGPPAAAIRAMGSKSAAKKIMAKAKVPLVPGYHEDAQDLKTMITAATQIGYPVLLKATAGGGGKGMRIVWKAEEIEAALASAKREALANFGDNQILIEKYIIEPRHVEIQVFADTHGNYVYLFERDCSIQRRHQKIIEEAPAPALAVKLREQMGKCAVAAAKAIGYVGAGTVEFLLDKDKNFYFMEMNTRLQVEHPVTEMITGQDLVEWQLKVAAGLSLPLKQEELQINGHAFEVRIYAEDPQRDFIPSIGTIQYLKTPEENNFVRIDSGIAQGDSITPYYDPMITKLIVWDIDRNKALQRLAAALGNYQLVGVNTNLDFLAAIACHPAFIAEKINTGFIEEHSAELFKIAEVTSEVLALASLYLLLQQKIKAQQTAKKSFDQTSPWYLKDSWRPNLPAEQNLRFNVQGNEINVLACLCGHDYRLKMNGDKILASGDIVAENKLLVALNGHEYTVTIYVDGETIHLLHNGQRYQFTWIDEEHADHQGHLAETKARLTSPMPSRVVALLAKTGDSVVRGASLAVVEAMKMEHTIYAPADGVVKEWYFKEGDLVDEGVELLAFEEVK